jgi:hypothetical protein
VSADAACVSMQACISLLATLCCKDVCSDRIVETIAVDRGQGQQVEEDWGLLAAPHATPGQSLPCLYQLFAGTPGVPNVQLPDRFWTPLRTHTVLCRGTHTVHVCWGCSALTPPVT